MRRMLLVTLAGVLVAACGGGGEDGDKNDSLSGEAARGKQLVEVKGCLQCHSTDGRRGVGPSWKGVAGSQVKLADGTTVTADAEYLRRSILDPDAQTVAGFPPGLMASTIRPGTLTDDEAVAMVAYLQTL